MSKVPTNVLVTSLATRLLDDVLELLELALGAKERTELPRAERKTEKGWSARLFNHMMAGTVNESDRAGEGEGIFVRAVACWGFRDSQRDAKTPSSKSTPSRTLACLPRPGSPFR